MYVSNSAVNRVDAFCAELRGEYLSAVTFVMDYLQLDFSGRTLNVYSPLTVFSDGASIRSWQPGFRDLLCGQITKVVASVEYDAEQSLTILYEDASFLSVSLRRTDYKSPEAFETFGFSEEASLEA